MLFKAVVKELFLLLLQSTRGWTLYWLRFFFFTALKIVYFPLLSDIFVWFSTFPLQLNYNLNLCVSLCCFVAHFYSCFCDIWKILCFPSFKVNRIIMHIINKWSIFEFMPNKAHWTLRKIILLTSKLLLATLKQCTISGIGSCNFWNIENNVIID